MSRPDLGLLLWCVGGSAVLSLLLTTAMRGLAPRLGMVDHPGGRKDHARPTPLLGGVAIYVATVAGYLLAASLDRRAGLVMLGGALILGLGLWDDRVGLRARFRLAAQLLGATGVVAAGYSFQWFAWAPADHLLTIIWLVGVTNAMNCLDCADGIAPGVAAIAAAAYGVIALAYGHFAVEIMAIALLGSCLGFLCLNFPPARIFLGDAGSTILGLLLGAVAVGASRGASPWHQAWVAGLPLAVPIWDIILVHLRRYRAGTRNLRVLLESSGRDHLPHRLRSLGLTPRAVAFSVYLMTLGLALPGVLIARYQFSALVLAGEVGLLFLLVGERPFAEVALLVQGWRRAATLVAHAPARGAEAPVRATAPSVAGGSK